VLLYECVTGRLPFDAHNYNALLRSIVEDKPPTLFDLTAADAELSQIVEVGMAKDRNERWRSMHELGIALAAWLKRQGVLEDATGASLDTKWLNRKSDPAGRLSRPSMSEIPDGIISPASGVAVTVRAPRARDSTTPTSVPTSTSSGSVIPLTRRPIAQVVAAGLLLGLLLAYALTRSGNAPPERDATVRTPTEHAPATSPAPAPTPSPAVTPMAQVEKASTAESDTKTPPSVPSARTERGRAVAPHKKSAPEASARPPSSDLIAPY
jgi:serine/threonine-protein kinase